jgi:hypothetical protein
MFEGHAEISAALRARNADPFRRTAHRIGLFDFTRTGDTTEATGNLAVHVISPDDCTRGEIGLYESKFVRDENGWRILALSVTPPG